MQYRDKDAKPPKDGEGIELLLGRRCLDASRKWSPYVGLWNCTWYGKHPLGQKPFLLLLLLQGLCAMSTVLTSVAKRGVTRQDMATHTHTHTHTHSLTHTHTHTPT
jgi:hypothetical protein